VDGTSEAAFEASIERVKEPLDGPTRAEFERALGTLMFNRVVASAGDKDALTATMRRTFDGKTAAQIIDDAKRVKAEADEAGKELLE
jgi:hypothetical protein